MKILETYIINYNDDDDYEELCKVHLIEGLRYVREYETGKKKTLVPMSKEEFEKQSANPLN